MRDLSELGIKPYSRREPPFRSPTKDEIASFEGAFNTKLPSDYIEFLHRFNGGRSPALDRFITSSGYTCAVGRFFYLLPEDPKRLDTKHHPNGWEFGNLWAETRSLRAAILRNMSHPGLADVRQQMTDRVVPFASDTGNASHFVFDRRTAKARVCLAISDRGFALVELADSFATFIDKLNKRGDD